MIYLQKFTPRFFATDYHQQQAPQYIRHIELELLRAQCTKLNLVELNFA